MNEDELKKFLINKNLVAFMEFGKKLRCFKMHYLVKKYNIRLIYLVNLGAMGNHYLGKSISGKRETKILRYYLFILKKKMKIN